MSAPKYIALVLFLCLAVSSAGSTFPQEAEAETRPNVLFILTDDMRVKDLSRMPKTQALLKDEGTYFKRSFVTDPLCCPSRATLLTGQYQHNHGVYSSEDAKGGAAAFRSSGADRDTLATRLDAAGYTTGLFGKYMNAYDSNYIPPSWDTWRGFRGDYNAALHQGLAEGSYRINENGETIRRFVHKLHDNDYLADNAAAFVGNHQDEPWFLLVGTNAPHGPSYSAERHKDMFRHASLPKTPALNEADTSDKPADIRAKIRFGEGGGKRFLTRQHRKRIRSLQSVDDMVADLVKKLKQTGQMKDTYVVFTSDNGFLLGEHGLYGKEVPYEDSIRVPLIVRGPDVPRGVVCDEIVANNDWMPTVADWSGADISEVDGRSLDPLFSKAQSPQWRDALLIEHGVSIPYSAIRTEGEMYVEYGSGEREFYDLEADPYQLENLVGQRPEEEAALAARLEELRDCAGEECREAENP